MYSAVHLYRAYASHSQIMSTLCLRFAPPL